MSALPCLHYVIVQQPTAGNSEDLPRRGFQGGLENNLRLPSASLNSSEADLTKFLRENMAFSVSPIPFFGPGTEPV